MKISNHMYGFLEDAFVSKNGPGVSKIWRENLIIQNISSRNPIFYENANIMTV